MAELDLGLCSSFAMAIVVGSNCCCCWGEYKMGSPTRFEYVVDGVDAFVLLFCKRVSVVAFLVFQRLFVLLCRLAGELGLALLSKY